MNVELRHTDLEELLGAYALDAVDQSERDLVDRHLPTCARCRAEVEEHREVAALLAHTGATAPDGLWDRIAGSLEAEPPELELPRLSGFPAPVPDPAPPVPLRPRSNRLAAAILAAAAAVIVVLGVQMTAQDQRLDEVTALLELDTLERAYQAAASTPGAEVIEITSFDGVVDAQAVITDDGEGYLRAGSLPRLVEGRTYQLWGDAGEKRVSLGPLGPDPHVVPFEVSEQFVGLAITEEAEPGVVVSEQPILAYGELPA